MTFDKLLL